MAALEKIIITDVKFPEGADQSRLAEFKEILETEIIKWNLIISLDDLVATLEDDQNKSSDILNMEAPVIIYANEPTTMVLIDGEPRVNYNDNLKMETVINTPFLIVKNPSDKKYYLYTGEFWYASDAISEGWTHAAILPPDIDKLNKELQDQDKNEPATADTATAKPTAILVRTKPAELIQTDGEAKLASLQGTGLLYVTNSPDYIFKSIDDQHFYIVITGRWYKSKSFSGPWTFVSSEDLPSDFAKIPEGSPMDIVLANVAGTDAAREAVMEAQIPQTAKADRKTTICTVNYDGSPTFEPIKGTNMEVALNSSVTVIKSGKKYYAVDNGIWFVSADAKGPWEVSEDRPEEVEKIPPDNQAYNTKYVYVYDVTPDYIYMGYTPGYMGCYVYGPTVVYGTGFYYAPWYGAVYYPRPATYGFSMHYNPWTGWSMGFHYHTGCFSFHAYSGGYHGGYWGPPMYRPPYYRYPPHHPPYYGHKYHGGGYYGNGGYNNHRSSRGQVTAKSGNMVDNSLSKNRGNIYNQRPGVSTRDVPRNPGKPELSGGRNQASNPVTRNKANPGTSDRQPQKDLNAPSKQPKASNNMYSDKSGNIYKTDKSGNWQQRSGDSWQNSPRENTRDLDRSKQQRDRSSMRTNQSSAARTSPGSANRGGSGGNARMGGGRR